MQAVHALITELAVFEKEPNAVKVSISDLERDGFGKDPKFHCFVAEVGKRSLALLWSMPGIRPGRDPLFIWKI